MEIPLSYKRIKLDMSWYIFAWYLGNDEDLNEMHIPRIGIPLGHITQYVLT